MDKSTHTKNAEGSLAFSKQALANAAFSMMMLQTAISENFFLTIF